MSDLRKAIEELADDFETLCYAPIDAQWAAKAVREVLAANPEPEPKWEWGLSYNRYTPALKDEKNARYLAEEDPEVFTLFKRTAPGPWIEVEG